MHLQNPPPRSISQQLLERTTGERNPNTRRDKETGILPSTISKSSIRTQLPLRFTMSKTEFKPETKSPAKKPNSNRRNQGRNQRRSTRKRSGENRIITCEIPGADRRFPRQISKSRVSGGERARDRARSFSYRAFWGKLLGFGKRTESTLLTLALHSSNMITNALLKWAQISRVPYLGRFGPNGAISGLPGRYLLNHGIHAS